MQVIRAIDVEAHEVMLDIGNLDWVSVYIINRNAFVLPPTKRATQVLMKNAMKQKDLVNLLKVQFDVESTCFPCQG